MAPPRTVQVVKPQVDLTPVTDSLDGLRAAFLELAGALTGYGELGGRITGAVWNGEQRQMVQAAPLSPGAFVRPDGAVIVERARPAVLNFPLTGAVTTCGPVETLGHAWVNIIPIGTNAQTVNAILTQVSNDALNWSTGEQVQDRSGTIQLTLIPGATYRMPTGGARFVQIVTGTGSTASALQMVPGDAGYVNMGIKSAAGASFSTLGGIADATAISAAAWVPLDVDANCFQFNGATWDRPRNNIASTVLASAAYTGTQSVDQTNFQGTGLVVFLNLTTLNNASVTLHIREKDPASGLYADLLASVAVVAPGFSVYQVGPGLPATANVSANAIVPRNYNIQVVPGAGGLADTYSVATSLTSR